jgi:glutathione reductase (NADPH)
MAPTSEYTHDYIVIGGGSGGSGAARRASGWYKAKTVLIENGPSGGCCVNVGCVPKKMTWNFASVHEILEKGKYYDYDIPSDIKFDFGAFKKKRDEAIKRLNAAYERNWNKEGIDLVRGTAKFVAKDAVEVILEDGSGSKVFKAPHICIATGGYPVLPKDVLGAEHGITSDGFFDFEVLPKRIGIAGAGYIAVEMAGILNAMGVEVHLFIRGKTFLRKFDPMIQDTMTKRYEDVGVIIHREFSGFERIERLDEPQPLDGPKHESRGQPPSPTKRLKLTTKGSESLEVGELLWAVGRRPEIQDLDLASIGVKLNDHGFIQVDDFQNTSIGGIYALGDVTGQMELTPGKVSINSNLV